MWEEVVKLVHFMIRLIKIMCQFIDIFSDN